MEENFSMEWKIFGMEWKWNGRKLSVWNMEKSSSIPFHTMPCLLAPTLFRYKKHNKSYVKSMTVIKNAALQHIGPRKGGRT